MKINSTITITRPSYGDGRRLISITLLDTMSGIEFFDGEIELADFAEALTGLSDRPITAEVRGLKYLGMKMVTESREISCPLDTYDRSRLSEWLEDNAQEDGWVLSTYLGSKNYVTRQDGVTILRYSVTKYVEPEGESTQP